MNERDTALAGRLFVLTGPPGSGKTTWCRAVATAAARRGLIVRGFLAVVEPGPCSAASASGAAPTERWLHDLGSGERRLLGREAPPEAAATGDPRWRLFDDTLAWGDQLLRSACPTDLLIVDEVGPVELLHRRGWWTGLQEALRGPCGDALVVVRPWLVPRFLDVWHDRRPQVVDVRHTRAQQVMEGLLGSAAVPSESSVRASAGVEARS